MAQRRGGTKTTLPWSAVRTVRKRSSSKAEENIALRDQHHVLQAQLNTTLKHIEDVIATVQVQDQQNLQVCVELDQLQHDVNRL